MESNPLVPRQRSRRSDRTGAEQQPVQQAYPVQAQPVQQSYPVQPQTPRTMHQQPAAYQQPAVNQPVRPSAASYPQTVPVQQAYPQTGYQQAPAPQSGQTQPAPYQQTAQPQVQYGARTATPRPRVLNQPNVVNSGWQQPTIHEAAEVPHARATRSLTRETAREARIAQREAEARMRQEAREKAEWEAEKARRAAGTEKPKKKSVPGWMTTALSLCFLLVLALGTAYWLMQAYLTTQENARIAAWEAVKNNYHVTESADGTLRVTWQEHIEKYAAQYNLQPAFVTAIIRNESSFRTGAESSVGARGLMQLMPDTAEWIAGKLNDHSYTFDSMWDAETNIRYGCWYLGYLSRLFRGDAELVSAAYHAGQSTITQWLSDPDKSSDGVTLDLDKLSDGPTKQYIGRVTQTYGIYQSLLYPDEAFGAADAVPAGSIDGAASAR